MAALAESTDISKGTLSCLETGQRRPSLELLLPITSAHQVTLDELVASPRSATLVCRSPQRRVDGRTGHPLTRRSGSIEAFKITIPGEHDEHDVCVHDGYEWLYVLFGSLRLFLADHDLVVAIGEGAEFDTRLPHWLGSSGDGPVEILSLFGRQGEWLRVRARRGRPAHRHR